MILVIDNYDSFVHNLARYVRQFGCETEVVRNDKISIESIRALAPQAIVISPGPCSPDEAGISLSVVTELQKEFPILGICLGHQAIIQAFGGSIVPAIEPIHGRSSQVFHLDTPLFQGVPSPFVAGRYHSLIGAPSGLPECLRSTAFTDDRTIMAIEHRHLPIYGLQFHPESILTGPGYQLIQNFLELAGIEFDNNLQIELLDRGRFSGAAGDDPAFDAKPYPISPRLKQSPTESS
ncbi:MAG: aminodeoxychorismate/anthranilate synthase component II [Planctomycetota bacterium]